MAATWDTELVQREGQAIGQEVKALGRDMILGPTVNINRVPLWGRNFEGYGEDPYLSAQLGVAYIHGVQGEGVIPSVKHFAANNEEFERHRIDANIDERTLHEIYLPAFKAAVQEADVWTVMSAYNKVNGMHCAENRLSAHRHAEEGVWLQGICDLGLGQHLLDGADGECGHGSGDAGRAAGQEHGWRIQRTQASGQRRTDGWLQRKVLAEVKAGHITEATIDDNVGRILRVIFLSGIFDHPHTASAMWTRRRSKPWRGKARRKALCC